MPPSLWDYTNQALERELRHIETTADSEVYVVALYVASAVDVDPRWSTLRLLWDTEMHYGQRLHGEAAELSDGRWDTTDFMRAAEPLWDPQADPDGHRALESWARENELWFDGAPLSESDDQIEREIALHKQIVAGLIATVRGLHDSGIVQAVFGRPIPIILIPQDSHDPYPRWNAQANPPELYAEFGPYLESIWSPG